MFGALRKLIVSGDIRGLLDGSRRAFREMASASGFSPASGRERALNDMNARGGIEGPRLDAREYLDSRGVDVNAMTAPGTGNPYSDFSQSPYYINPPSSADSPFGGVVVEGPSGSRTRYSGSALDYNFPRGFPQWVPPGQRRGQSMQSPYEGTRTWGEYGQAPSRWSGGGEPPFMSDMDPYFDDYVRFAPVMPDEAARYGDQSNVPYAFGGDSMYAPRRTPYPYPYYQGEPMGLGANPFGQRYVPWDRVMRTRPMDDLNSQRNIPF
jgi:hypothetical protein